MEMPSGIAARLDRLAGVVDPRASTARGMLDQHAGTEAYHAPRSPDVVAFPETSEDLPPSLDLRA